MHLKMIYAESCRWVAALEIVRLARSQCGGFSWYHVLWTLITQSKYERSPNAALTQWAEEAAEHVVRLLSLLFFFTSLNTRLGRKLHFFLIKIFISEKLH